MSYYGTMLVARSERPLIEMPEVRSAFGTRWRRLYRRDDGWQLLETNSPFPHQGPMTGAGAGPLADVTGVPVLVVWIEEGSCVQVVLAMPGGAGGWSRHLPRPDDIEGMSCPYDHDLLGTPADVDQATFVQGLAGWVVAAGFDADAEEVDAALRGFTGDVIFGLADACGFDPSTEVERLFDHHELDWWDVWQRGYMAGWQVCRELANGEPMDDDPPPPGAAEFLRFIELVADSMHGGGWSREELAAEALRLEARWPDAKRLRGVEAEHGGADVVGDPAGSQE